MNNEIESIKRLHELFEQGILTKEEYEEKKQQILTSGTEHRSTESAKNETNKQKGENATAQKITTSLDKKRNFSVLKIPILALVILALAVVA